MYINYTYYYIGKSKYTLNLTTHVLLKTDFSTFLFVFFSVSTVTKFNRTDHGTLLFLMPTQIFI